MESRHLTAGSYLFRTGDRDDSIYVVESGRIHLFVTEQVINNFYIYSTSNLNLKFVNSISFINKVFEALTQKCLIVNE